uniref:C-type lectin domain-containing protein n=1 Tax=Seriola dumerili TaxID=41447 RepID=A0A3B4V0R5_SERDU
MCCFTHLLCCVTSFAINNIMFWLYFQPTASVSQAGGTICPAGWLSFAGSCYWTTESVKNWQDAEAHCNSEQGHLASFHSQEELSFLTGERQREHSKAWVGLNDINVENQFVYTDGSAADFLLWGPNQPDNWQNNEDCVHLRGMNHQTPGKLNDDSCTSTKEFICKKAVRTNPAVTRTK